MTLGTSLFLVVLECAGIIVHYRPRAPSGARSRCFRSPSRRGTASALVASHYLPSWPAIDQPVLATRDPSLGTLLCNECFAQVHPTPPGMRDCRRIVHAVAREFIGHNKHLVGVRSKFEAARVELRMHGVADALCHQDEGIANRLGQGGLIGRVVVAQEDQGHIEISLPAKVAAIIEVKLVFERTF